ncbi:MAG: hypothetical protein JSS95_10550 [Acidobacteria bacterium]|nr:hypothetical protein [Acidobacteriota bacterium]
MTNDSRTTLSTISDVESAIQAGLEALRNAPLNDRITAALSFLAPEGFTPVIQLEEDGRKKRNTAAASNWSPENGEILIYFEPAPNKASTSAGATPEPTLTSQQTASPEAPPASLRSTGVTTDEIRQCCEALAEVEIGKLFVALTRFRDKDLPRYPFAWAASADSRHRVLTGAIESGAILVNKIHNPKSEHQTTTVKLNRSGQMRQIVSARFHPVPVRGEPVSATIMRERGSL